ncbi:MAG TPA: nicotinate-nucleotide--dimethylbenzimidazole phosphoribosyltransferase [Gordonia sp. (in: high G+C Gram-positive bacteria)]|uniref:nicotinate-nucleotide--dimethylbenzimidazole phosphoribosyltransferase n=1 Tax=unclassified Gordonia (in: high G+C Gram-positive bacteria) TaxID=2657482 RepID=UPI000FA5B896|nr:MULTISPECIES: nicotinate-nucleotide--dimethylbenzimidazole phosphoribosyltransferase [unclassified Gordonia (in: high G+C Gram-positive bacteria)]RTL09269.1 MAG: nicotinate-nucleotide--dimethylbenzimidazole phosphoribosyltransferase [Acidimicrobiia bacterium]HNP58654.1 nicotinate-nucleotide--dimethylbenzimidazole phosphoribosyltransferase [Gordonia sp. (in: high G+C Gram-positive bacteria)]HRC52325.1 nicotinate-nucleotide--dimethylbenzimidazole phosphoribosyltransferase [Gordonia sp. (in: hig
MRTLVLGGVRSGKSAHAESLLAGLGTVRYVATGPIAVDDDEWAARVAEHRARRAEAYETVETTDAAAALRARPDVAALVDDLGNWVAALVDWEGPADDTAFDEALAQLCAALREHRADIVVVSPEVGLSVVPETSAGRRFQDLMGRVNQAVAEAVDETVLLVAGRVVALTDSPTPRVQTVAATGASVFPTDTAAPVDEAVAAAVVTPATTVASPVTVDPTDAEVFAPIEPPDSGAATAARIRQTTLTKPPGSLGRLEDLGNWISACQGTCPPKPITSPTVVVFAGDHGVAGPDTEGGSVSAFPQVVTEQMVANFIAGGAAVNVLARRAGAAVRVEDIAVITDTAPAVSRYKVCRGSNDLRVTDAITLAEARQAVAAGRAITDELVDSGVDLLIAGDMGIGNTTPAAILVGLLAHDEPVVVVGRGTGIDDAGWIRKTAAIRDGMWRGRHLVDDPLSLVAAVGGADFAAMAGFLAQAAVRRTPVILDGVVVTAAALVADELAPGAVDWWRAGHMSTEPAHAIALRRLGLTPLLELDMRLGEASGALAALPLVTVATDILATMATFGEAGVSDA